MSGDSFVLAFSPKHAVRVLVAILVLLLVANAAGLVMHYGFGHDYVYGLVPLFNIGIEQSIPTLFATLLLLGNAFLFFILSRTEKSSSYLVFVWLLLTLIFCFVGIDEYAVIHERLIAPVRESLGVGGYLYFAWIIPYGFAVLLLALLVIPALWRLGWRYRLLFGISALTYLGGAVGVEMLGGNYLQLHHDQVDLYYRLFQTAEETLEFTGTIILVYTLLALLEARIATVTFQIQRI